MLQGLSLFKASQMEPERGRFVDYCPLEWTTPALFGFGEQ